MAHKERVITDNLKPQKVTVNIVRSVYNKAMENIGPTKDYNSLPHLINKVLADKFGVEQT